MPRGVAASRNVQTVRVDDSAGQSIDELMEGYPLEQQEIPAPRTDIHDPIVPSNILDSTPLVTLVNLRYPNEWVFKPQERVDQNGNLTTNNFSSQHYLTFTDGVLVCSERDAEIVLSQCPYVRVEPPDGQLNTYAPSGFSTRNPMTFAEHVERYNEDFMG